MADDLIEFEDVAQRAKPDVRKSAIIFRRVYRIPVGDTTTVPAVGAAVDLDGVTGSGITQPRVMNTPEVLDTKSGMNLVRIVFYKIRAYA